MIIKSTSRKSASFEQLYNYLTRDNDYELRSFNLFSNPKNKNETIKEFLKNAEYLKNSRGKNYLYHEIISLKQNNLPLEKQKTILEDLAFKYLSLRAENHLALTVLHSDKGHIHIHLMISANRILENRRTRLSKKRFRTIQQQIEIYSNQNYPQLEATNHYTQIKDKSKEKRAEQEIKHKRKKQTKKDYLKSKLKETFEKSHSYKYLKRHLEKLNIEIYTRGKNTGVIFNNKKYRLKILGLDILYKQTLKRLNKEPSKEFKQTKEKTTNKTKFNSFRNDDKITQRQKEMDKIREEQDRNRDFEFER